jgi:hypothetical protein
MGMVVGNHRHVSDLSTLKVSRVFWGRLAGALVKKGVENPFSLFGR